METICIFIVITIAEMLLLVEPVTIQKYIILQ